MRHLRVLLAAGSLLSAGCSILIARSGEDLADLTTREDVHARFGEPITSGVDNGASYEDFRSHRKYSEMVRSQGLGMGIAMTFGMGEFVAFPYEVLTLTRRTVFGQTLRFHYDETGTIKFIDLDKNSLRIRTTPNAAQKSTEPPEQ